MSRLVWCGLATALLFIGLGGVASASEEGREDLDKATGAKLAAETVADLAEVIQLTESAIKKGLNETDMKFAKQILSSSLAQRGSAAAGALFKGLQQNSGWMTQRKTALADLEKAVELDPQQSQAWLLIAQLNLLPGGDAKLAGEAIDKALAIEDDGDDQSVRAKVLVLRASMQTDADKKLADLAEAIRLVPNDATIVRARGLLLGDLGKFDASLVDLDKAIELDPDDTATYEAKAIVLARLKRFDESLATLDKAKTISPQSIAPLVQKANIHAQQENSEAAIADLNEALTMEPENAIILLLRAQLYQERDEKDKAMADVDRALQLRANFPIAIRTRALFLAEDKKFKEAAQELEKLRKLDPKDTLTLMQLGRLYGAEKQFEKSIEAYTALLAEQPDEWRALHGRGDGYLNLGKHAEAIADYDKAVAIEPKNHGVLNNLAWVLATSPNEKLRNGKRAIQMATLACEVTEYKLSYILSTLAAAYAETGDFENAKKWSVKSIEIDEQEHGDALKKELQSYEAGKPWRELLPSDEPDASPAEKPEKKAAEKKATEKKATEKAKP